jgi:nicotinamidase-related amidase
MNSAILVIDVQNGVFDNSSNVFERDIVLEKIIRIIDHARSCKSIIAFIQHEAPGIVEYGSNEWQLHPSLPQEQVDIRVRKSTPDAFHKTTLEEQLKEHKIENVIICGYSSDFCIDRTTFKAASSGYSVTLIEDAHTTHDKPHLRAPEIREHHNFVLSKHPAVKLKTALDFING